MSAELRRVHGPSVALLLPPVAPAPAPEVVPEPVLAEDAPELLAEDAPEVPDELVWIGNTQRQ
jgi:hypothetical protein